VAGGGVKFLFRFFDRDCIGTEVVLTLLLHSYRVRASPIKPSSMSALFNSTQPETSRGGSWYQTTLLTRKTDIRVWLTMDCNTNLSQN